jgi:hypothetical protein
MLREAQVIKRLIYKWSLREAVREKLRGRDHGLADRSPHLVVDPPRLL